MIFYPSSTNSSHSNQKKGPNYFFIGIEKLALGLFNILKEVFIGIKTNTISWPLCCFFLVLANFVLLASLDVWMFDYFGYSRIYLEFHYLSYILYVFLATLGFVAWGTLQSNLKKKFLKRLKEAFINADLKTKSGRFPNFISDVSIDKNNRKLTLHGRGITLSQFSDETKNKLQSSLQIFIDDVQENIQYQTIDIYYSHVPLPTEVKFDEIEQRKNYGYTVGVTRSKEIRSNFKDSPHLLVAGQTTGGKSNFLRQIFMNLYLNNTSSKFSLIDLKEGLEFRIFKDLKRVNFLTFDQVEVF